MMDAYAQLEIEPESYELLQDEYTKLKNAYKKLRSEHLALKKDLVSIIEQCWIKVDSQYNCKSSMSESLNRISSVDLTTVAPDELLGDLKTQIETMLHQVYLNCEVSKSLEFSKVEEAKNNVELSELKDFSDFVGNLDEIQNTVEAFNIMLDNVTLQQLVTNAPDETHRSRIDLSNKTIVQVLNSMKNVMQDPVRTKYPKRLKDLQSQFIDLLSNKANLTMMWNNQFKTCVEHVESAPRRSFRKPRFRPKSRSVGPPLNQDSGIDSPRTSSRSRQLLIRFTNAMLPEEARIRDV